MRARLRRLACSLAHHLLGGLLERASALVVQLLLLRHRGRPVGAAQCLRAHASGAGDHAGIVVCRVHAERASRQPLALETLVHGRALLKKS